jgi:cytochrome b561
VIEVSLLKMVGIASLSLLVIAWLAVSLLAPGKARSRVAWVAATCLYLVLLCLFLMVFLCGVVVSAVKTVGQFAGRGSAQR